MRALDLEQRTYTNGVGAVMVRLFSNQCALITAAQLNKFCHLGFHCLDLILLPIEVSYTVYVNRVTCHMRRSCKSC